MTPLRHLLVAMILFSGCSFSSETLKEETGYPYYYKGSRVIIASKNKPKDGVDPYNILVSDELQLKAVDFNQDAVIDAVVEGKFDLAQVQHIYQSGLDAAVKHGKLRQRDWEYVFDFREGDHTYQIRSYLPLNGKPFIEFFIVGKIFSFVKALDQQSDGTIDYILDGQEHSIISIQDEYEKVLKKGLELGELEQIDNLIRVKRPEQKERSQPMQMVPALAASTSQITIRNTMTADERQ